MKKALFALAGMPVLCLFTAVALAGDLPPPDATPKSTITPDEVIKNKNQCFGNAFFKNAFPALTNGNDGGCTTENFPVEGETIPMTVCWGPSSDPALPDDNSFEFSLVGGAITRLGVSVDTNDWIYEYATAAISDGPLNSYAIQDPTIAAGDVAHLDICMQKVDTTKPTIEFVFPQEGATVSGDKITVIVRTSDESGLAPGYPKLSVDDGSTTDVEMLCEPLDSTTFECKADWSTLGLVSGTYTVTVVVKDNAVPEQNTQTASVTVTLAQSLASCFGLIGDEDFDPDNADVYGDGCQITTMLNVQASPDVNPACLADNPPPECTVSGYQYEPDPLKLATLACDSCGEDYCGTYGLPDPRMMCIRDQLGECTNDWVPQMPLTALHISDVAKDGPEGPVPGTLGANVFGYKGCFVASRLQRGGLLTSQYTAWPSDPPTGLVWTLTYSLKESLNDDVIVECNLGGKFASQGGYQPLGKNESVDTTATGLPAVVLAATQECQNPPRTLTRDNGVDVGNVYETDDSGDVVAFKIAQAQKQFDAVQGPALTCAGGDYIKGKVKFSDVTSPINQAKAQFSNGTVPALIRAYEDLQDSACAIRAAKWRVTAENCPGDLLSRVENLAYRMKDLVAAKDPGFDIGSLRESPCLIVDPAP